MGLYSSHFTETGHGSTQSHTQSPQPPWPAVGHQERLWGSGIVLPQDFCGKTITLSQGSQSKNLNKIAVPQSLSCQLTADWGPSYNCLVAMVSKQIMTTEIVLKAADLVSVQAMN